MTDARTPLELLLSLSNTTTPSTEAERSSYLNALVQHKLYELAYYSWLQFLPQEQLSKTGRLFNGSFDAAPSGLPFDWVFTRGAGVNLKFAQRSDQEGKRALLIEFGPGRVDFSSGLSELVLLPPGDYKLVGKYKADLVSQRGLEVVGDVCRRDGPGWRKQHDEWVGLHVERYRSRLHHSPRRMPRSICEARSRCAVGIGAVRLGRRVVR